MFDFWWLAEQPIIFNMYHDSLLAGHQGPYCTAMTIRQKFQERSSSTFYQSTPPLCFQNHYLILHLNRKLVNFNLKWIWIYGLEPHLPPLSNQKNKMLILGLRSTSDDQPGWSMDSNPIHHPSPAKKIKCSFIDYIQLLMIGWAGRWTQTPSATPLQPKKIKCSFLDYIQLLMIAQAGQWTRTPSATPLQPKK